MVYYGDPKYIVVNCPKCNTKIFKYQPLKFSLILNHPYIRCPKCNKKYYLNFND